MKMKKILIALDYDPSAQSIAEVGYSLARTMDAEVILLHVISDSVIYTSPGHVTIVGFAGCMEAGTTALQEDCKDELKKAANQFLDKSKQHLCDEAIKTIVKDGDCAETILKTAAEVQADIIVLGSHSKKILEKTIAGSIIEAVLRHSSIPLFIIPLKKTIK
jgi:nucleotide-binding universal stress UspA family protein